MRSYWSLLLGFTIHFIHAASDIFDRSLSNPFTVITAGGDVPGLVYADWIFPGDMLSDDEKLVNFRDWVSFSTAISVHPAVGLWNFGDGRRFGIRANMDISRNKLICDVPDTDMICGRSFDADIMPKHLNTNEVSFSWDPTTPAREDAPLVYLDATIIGPAADTAIFKLIYELLLGDRSHWKPYLDIIPSLLEYEEYAVLLWGEESKREWMENGTAQHVAEYEKWMDSFAQASNIQNYLCKQFGGIASPLMRRLLCDNTLLRWASAALATRAISIAEHGSCFIPFIDLINHGSDRNNLLPVFESKPRDLSKNGEILSGGILNARDYKKGDELMQTYLSYLNYLAFFISYSFTPRGGYLIIENSDYESQSILDVTAFNISRELNCWVDPPRLQYMEDEISGSAACVLSAVQLTCYRLRRSLDLRRTQSIMSGHHKRLQKAHRLAEEAGENTSDPISFFSAVYFTAEDTWETPIPLRVKVSDKTAIEDLLRDIHRHHSLLKTTGTADVALSEHGATRALRNIGSFRVNERRSIEYCMAAVSKHLDKIDALFSDCGKPKRSGASNGRGGDGAGTCEADALQGVCEEAPTKKRRPKKTKTKTKKYKSVNKKPEKVVS
jgi:hypothetical protein